MASWFILAAVVLVALLFDFTNGFHDAANAIATSISTRALAPATALAMAAALNVLGAFVSTHVAATLAKGIVDPKVVTQTMILAGLVGAIGWNLITWYFGIPSSSSHALIGGVTGAVLYGYGRSGINWEGIWHKLIIPTVASPVLGFLLGGILLVLIAWIFRRVAPAVLNRRFRHAQTVTAGMMAFSHGSNDAQKTMGVIALALFAGGAIKTPDVPTWVKLSSALAMGLGTYVGGWRIIRTLGSRVAHLTPVDGFAAEAAASAVLFGTAQLGFPVSTTHVITASVTGVGATRRIGAVRWGLTRDIVIAWILTLPASALMGGGFAAVSVGLLGR